MKFSYLYIIFFFLITHLQSDDLKIYNIGFLDIKEDMRYSKWGIHPVDIRSKLNKEKRIEMFQPEDFLTRSQDLEDAWHDAGQFCWGKSNAWLKDDILFSKKTIPIEIPR